ncbi:hypothetical protein [Desulfoluna spongiiphila]|uniref:Uncharacterized protein n=1 Tax=Desulfoluna spongiiphila TaxID=419481 RepID=A0A1G5J3T4_9BACT|nr:hypothetical protein [Desulfoluna spongiiphila]SCY82368.1 hypothetical protein SAMN05216233_12424 [Desulfoluna spongiiphila]VVS94488.1 hypothetical protein DBB_40600 [Desulfoluna spongiiphila]
MGLGPNHDIATTEFINAMRARLEREDENLGKNMDDPAVRKNMGALAEAVYRIVTAHTDAVSSPIEDPEFWEWMDQTNRWLQTLAQWQKGVAQALDRWAAATPADLQLKADLAALTQPEELPEPPTTLKGRLS